MKLEKGHVLCACSWHGKLAARASCPACGRPAIDRMDQSRIAALRAVAAQPDVDLHRMQLSRLIEIGVLRRDSPPTPPNSNGRHKRIPRRRHALTDRGVAVMATADLLSRGSA